MSELRQILELRRQAKASGEELCLATVVRIEGSSYRKPGARMLLTRGGRRAGTVSGGCLEGEIQKKAWWLTESGPTVQSYSSFFDEDSEMPFGLGCGGTVTVLLERGEAAECVLAALEANETRRAALGIVSFIDTSSQRRCGTRVVVSEDEVLFGSAGAAELIGLARQALREQRSFWEGAVFAEYVPPPAGLFVFGAGDDAQPLVQFAHELGWQVRVADGRSHLAARERFPLAHEVKVTRSFKAVAISEHDAAVVMTHSYEQDLEALRALLPRGLTYLGILGPRRRTERLLAEVGPKIGLSVEECFARLHAPVGLKIGATTPVSIALAIVAEVHAVFAQADAERRSGKTAGQACATHA